MNDDSIRITGFSVLMRGEVLRVNDDSIRCIVALFRAIVEALRVSFEAVRTSGNLEFTASECISGSSD